MKQVRIFRRIRMRPIIQLQVADCLIYTSSKESARLECIPCSCTSINVLVIKRRNEKMTSTQNKFWEIQESVRHNREAEALSRAANEENRRANQERERLTAAQIAQAREAAELAAEVSRRNADVSASTTLTKTQWDNMTNRVIADNRNSTEKEINDSKLKLQRWQTNINSALTKFDNETKRLSANYARTKNEQEYQVKLEQLKQSWTKLYADIQDQQFYRDNAEARMALDKANAAVENQLKESTTKLNRAKTFHEYINAFRDEIRGIGDLLGNALNVAGNIAD